MANKNPANQFGPGNKAAVKAGGPRVKTSATLSPEAYALLPVIAKRLGINKSEALDEAILAFAKMQGIDAPGV